MLHIKYTPPVDLELSANPSELLTLSAEIAAFTIHPKVNELNLLADGSVDPAPFTRCLTGLRVRRSAYPACVAVDGEELIIAGTNETLALFCSFLESAAQDGHVHYEYYEGDEYISPDSLPLVVRVE